MAEITRKLTETEQQIKAYQEMGKPRAIRNLIATNNEGLVKWTLNDTGYFNDLRRDDEEMKQEAFILLLEAIDEYDHTRGAFSTLYRYKVLNMHRKTELYNQDTSLNTIIAGEEDETELMDFIEDEEAQTGLIAVEDKDEQRQVREEVKNTLGDELAGLIFASYGIGEEQKTYREIGKIYGVTGSYIGHQIQKARYKLRRNIKLESIYNEYEKINYINTGSILEFRGTKTNRVNSIVEQATVRRLELEERIRLLAEENKANFIADINRRYEEDKARRRKKARA